MLLPFLDHTVELPLHTCPFNPCFLPRCVKTVTLQLDFGKEDTITGRINWKSRSRVKTISVSPNNSCIFSVLCVGTMARQWHMPQFSIPLSTLYQTPQDSTVKLCWLSNAVGEFVMWMSHSCPSVPPLGFKTLHSPENCCSIASLSGHTRVVVICDCTELH